VTPNFTKLISDSGIAYRKSGSGPCLFLIHGVGLKAESWYQHLPLLSQHFTVIAIDLPGHGNSRPLTIDYQQAILDDYTQAVSKFAVSATQQPFYLCGHSLGALIAIEMAASFGDKVLGIAALNAIYQRSDVARNAVQLRARQLHESSTIIGVKQTIDRWFGESPKPDQKNYALLCEDWLNSCDLAGYAMAYKCFADQRGPSDSTLESIACPSLYMTGTLDLNSSALMTQQLARLNPQAQAIVIENAGHMMSLTHAPDVSHALLNLASLGMQHA